MENPFEERQDKLQRPAFLSVLCILTFIGSGWAVMSNLFSVFMSGVSNNGNFRMEQYSSMVNELEGEGISSYWSDFLNSSVEMAQMTMLHAREIAVMQLVLGLISLLGAILMFRLRRVGFYLYTTAQILLLFILPYFAGFSLVVMISFIVSAFFALLFIGMYAANVKYMK